MMYRHETVKAAATAIVAHAKARGLSAPVAGQDGLRDLLRSLDVRMEALGWDLDREAALAHLERGKGLYLVTVADTPSAHDGPRGPRTYDLEVEAFSLKQALYLSLDGLRTRQWVKMREGSDPALPGFAPADPDRYAAMASMRQGRWDDVAPAIHADIAAKQAGPLPAPGPLPDMPRDCDEETAATVALLAHGVMLDLGDEGSTSSAGARRMLASLYDYAEACGRNVDAELREARAAREAAPVPAFR